MRNPVIVLKNLHEKSSIKDYRFERLYRNLYNQEFYLLAYKNIYANEGSMTKGTDGLTMDGMGTDRINKIINSLRDYSYQPKPVRREYIEKKNSTKKRPLGIPSTDDKLLQEVVRLLLESIYEPTFSKQSHGFRPGKSCHTALEHIKYTFVGVRWFVEGDIKACFDSFDHHTLINLLRIRIKDEHFIALMWKFLKAGYMEQWEYNQTYSGTPQGSGISPIFANIYLNELDKFMAQYKHEFDKGTRRRINPEYKNINCRRNYVKSKYSMTWDSLNDDEKANAINHVKQLKRQAQNLQAYLQTDESFRRIQYVRYADDFLIGVIGSKDEASKVKQDIKEFLESQLKLNLSDSKTLITHSSELIRFLGYDITISRSQNARRTETGSLTRSSSYKVKLYVPKTKWIGKLLEYKALKIKKADNRKEVWKSRHRAELMNKDCIEILSKYNSEIRGLYNFYCLASNATVLHNFSYIMEYSMYKTLAAKFNTSVGDVITKYSINGEFGIFYNTKKGTKRAVFYNQGFKRKDIPPKFNVDILPQYIRYDRPNSIASRIKAGLCEICGTKTDSIQMHQVKKLKDLNGSKVWEQKMISMRRKTLALCTECHSKLHDGLLD